MTIDAGQGDAIAEARRVLGDGRSDDWIVSPTRHAGELADAAPALAAVLRSSAVETVAHDFERMDADAIEAQVEFKRVAGRANIAVLTTAILSAAMLVLAAFGTLGDVQEIGLGVLGVLAVVGGGLASMWLFRLKQGKLFDRWNRARAAAETRRLEYFRLVTEAEGRPSSGPPLLLLQTEYFRRYQLDVQVAFYGGRARQHRRSAGRTLQMEAIAVLMATIGTGLGGVLAFASSRPEFAALAGFGVLGTALAAYAVTIETVNQNGRNAERYERTLASLLALRAKLDEVRESAATGDREPMLRFVDAVQEQLSLEHREWLDASEATRSSVGLLEAALRRSRGS